MSQVSSVQCQSGVKCHQFSVSQGSGVISHQSRVDDYIYNNIINIIIMFIVARVKLESSEILGFGFSYCVRLMDQ